MPHAGIQVGPTFVPTLALLGDFLLPSAEEPVEAFTTPLQARPSASKQTISSGKQAKTEF